MRPSPLQFGDLDNPANFAVQYCGQRLKLSRIPTELLFLLAARAGQLVTYQEAFEAIWRKGVVIEVQASLYTAVRKLRRALGRICAAAFHRNRRAQGLSLHRTGQPPRLATEYTGFK